MKTTTIAGTYYETVLVNTSRTRYEMTQGAVIYSGGKLTDDNALTVGSGIVEDIVNKPGIRGNVYDIDGTISALAFGIGTFGDRTTINIGKHADIAVSLALSMGAAVSAAGSNSKVTIDHGAHLSGFMGVVLAGSGSTATNGGQIWTDGYGMAAANLFGGGGEPVLRDVSLVNNGLIRSAGGMAAYGNKITMTNGADGEIVGFFVGMLAEGNATIVNHGSIRVTTTGEVGGFLGMASGAISGGVGVQKVTNDGMIVGNVLLGAGNDTFNTIGGVLKGKVYGGEGNDTFSIDNAKLKIVERADEGTDTIKSTISYKLAENFENLQLLGSKNLRATGNAGDNELLGNKGDNLLTGLGGIDTFHFGTKGGKDTIADFEIGVDKIDLSRWKGIADFDDVLSHARNPRNSDDVWITLGKDVLIIEGHHKADLVDTDFLFA